MGKNTIHQSYRIIEESNHILSRRKYPVGAEIIGNCIDFRVWAPGKKKVHLIIEQPYRDVLEMKAQNDGYFNLTIEKPTERTLYRFKLSNCVFPLADPASSYQPLDVHGPSEVIDHQNFKWTDNQWKGIPLEQMIIYELHTGTFTEQGTFEAIISRLPELKELGINAIEIMPVAQFPGERNWGYDGACLFAVQNSYGGPEKLKELINNCHHHNISVILDVVYNHFGPEGNYLNQFGPYFTDKYKTPWGNAINFDGPCSDQVRAYFLCNALFWLREYHIDALRLDALHAIYDNSARPFLKQLAEIVKSFSRRQGRTYYLIGESDLNDTKIIKPADLDGYGIDAQWCDDFHHCIHTLLTKEEDGFYSDFGKIGQLNKSLREGFVYSWQYSKYRKRHHGNSSRNISPQKFIVFSQNHDQIGNRLLGERLTSLVPFEALKLAAGIVLFSPYIPLLFMGEEYGEDAPFLYFVSHSDPDLIKAVSEGRKKEFAEFKWQREIPDPQSTESFMKSKLKWENKNLHKHKTLLEFYKTLIRMRKNIPALSKLTRDNFLSRTINDKKLIFFQRCCNGSAVICFANFEREDCNFSVNLPEGRWAKFLDSSEAKWQGFGGLLPSFIEEGQNLTMRALSFAAFSNKPITGSSNNENSSFNI